LIDDGIGYGDAAIAMVVVVVWCWSFRQKKYHFGVLVAVIIVYYPFSHVFFIVPQRLSVNISPKRAVKRSSRLNFR
jgi:hypothetical protein